MSEGSHQTPEPATLSHLSSGVCCSKVRLAKQRSGKYTLLTLGFLLVFGGGALWVAVAWLGMFHNHFDNKNPWTVLVWIMLALSVPFSWALRKLRIKGSIAQTVSCEEVFAIADRLLAAGSVVNDDTVIDALGGNSLLEYRDCNDRILLHLVAWNKARVFAAADKLSSDNREVTAQAVIDALGGSRSAAGLTAANVHYDLRDWRKARNSG